MMIAERTQALIHKLEVEGGARWLNYLALTVAVLSLAIWYDLHCYRNFANPEAMDAAQVARNLSAGNGFTTEFIRPFSVYLIQKHNHASAPNPTALTNAFDFAQIQGRHPDLANAPVYPLLLAGLWKLHTPDWKVEMHKTFWSEGGRFTRYPPEFFIAIFNQILLLVVVLLTFLVARKIFDTPAAWLALGAHEEDDPPFCGQVLYELRRLFEHLEGLLQIDNVDTIAFAEDVLLHPRIPALGLVPEVNARFEQLLHGDVSQLTSSVGLHPETYRFPDCHSRPPHLGGGGGMN